MSNINKYTFYLFFLILSAYVLSASGHFYSLDNYTIYLVTESLAEKRSLAVNEGQVMPGRDGRLYSIYGLGQSVLELPFYLAGRIFDRENDRTFSKMAVSFFCCLTQALTGIILFRSLYLLGSSIKISVFLTLVFCFCTMSWTYSKELFTSPVCGTFLLLCIYFALVDYLSTSYKNLAACSICFSLMILVRFEMIVLLPAVFLLYFWRIVSSKAFSPGQAAIFFSPLLAACGIVLWYNYYRFGTCFAIKCFTVPIEGGLFSQTPLLKGLFTTTFSLEKGLFIYNPILLFSAFMFRQKGRVFSNVPAWIALIILNVFLLYSRLPIVQGDWCWGSRYLIVCVPLFFIFFGEAMKLPLSRLKKTVFAVLFSVSLVIQLASVLINPINYFIDDKKEELHLSYQVKNLPAHAAGTYRNIKISLGSRTKEKENLFLTWRKFRFISFDLWYLNMLYAGYSIYKVSIILVLLCSIIFYSIFGMYRLKSR